MLNTRLLFLTALFSMSALAGVSIEEKEARVKTLELLSAENSQLNVGVYRRELEYEKLGLPLEQRAENEASLLAEKVRLQVNKAYETSVKSMSEEEAIADVRRSIEKDLELVDPSLKEELKELALNALENSQRGAVNSEATLTGIQNVLLKGVQERVAFLNDDTNDNDKLPSANKDRDSEKKEYKDKREFLDTLVSNLNNVRWISAATISMNSEELVRRDTRISLKIKASFLGVDIDAGPTISFNRSYKTYVSIMAEGLNPVLLPDGNFDYLVRDENGKPVIEGGKARKRFINYTCHSSMDYSTDYTGAGGFHIAGSGVRSSISKQFSSSVGLSSRRVLIPEYIGGKSATYKMLSDICHDDFLSARISGGTTVENSLNVMFKNSASSLRFSHPKTKCAVDSHCYNWFNREVLSISRIRNYARCVEEPRQKFRACELRGLQGQSCTVYNSKGERISSGMFEFKCDQGLKCVKVKDESWFKPAEGKCKPRNARTYRGPKSYSEDYIPLNFQ